MNADMLPSLLKVDLGKANLVQKRAWLCFVAIFFALYGIVAHADVERAKTFLSSDECLEAFSAIVTSERIDFGPETPFVYDVEGTEAEILLKYPSVWMYDEPSERRAMRSAMDALGFRTAGIWVQICEIRISDGNAGFCMIGMARENHNYDSAIAGFRTALEFMSGNRCNALLDQM